MKDRLPELRSAESSASDEDDDCQRSVARKRRSGRKKLRKPRSWKSLIKRRVKSRTKPCDGESSDSDEDLKSNHMKTFFSDVQPIKEDTEAIQKATKAIGEINEAFFLATTTDEENKCSRHLESLVDETNRCAKRAKNLLDLLKEENKRLADEEQAKPSDLLRVRENLCGSLTRKFITEVHQYQNAQHKYKISIKNKVKRQMQTIKPDVTDEEIDHVMRSKGGRDALYQELILEGKINDQVDTAYSKIRGKYQDILSLEQSISELHKLFLDFSLLTEQQGETLDQIEFQVKLASDTVEDGNVNIYESIEYQRKIRKKQCRILLIVAVVAAVVVAIVIL